MSLCIEIIPPHGNKQCVALSGRLDTYTFGDLDQQLAMVLDNAAICALVLDCKGLEYISSAGIRSIMKARKALAPRNGRIVLTNLQPQVRKVMDVVKVLPMSNIFASVAEADSYLDHLQRKVIEGDNPPN